MAVVVVALACVALWIDFHVVRYLYRTSGYRRAVEPAPRSSDLEQLFQCTFRELTELFELRACWFEPFPFDTALPRIEPGRITVPSDEPGHPPVAYTSIELPVRLEGLPVGRIVLLPSAQTVRFVASPSARDTALELAAVLAGPVAAALKDDDTSRFGALRSSARAVGPGHSRHVGP
jgi:hypothetical protein